MNLCNLFGHNYQPLSGSLYCTKCADKIEIEGNPGPLLPEKPGTISVLKPFTKLESDKYEWEKTASDGQKRARSEGNK